MQTSHAAAKYKVELYNNYAHLNSEHTHKHTHSHHLHVYQILFGQVGHTPCESSQLGKLYMQNLCKPH